MTSKLFLDILGIITTSKLSILKTLQGGALSALYHWVTNLTKIWWSRQGNKVSISFWLLVFDIISTSDLFSLHWADLQLNQYPSYKYLAVGLSIGCGIFSVFLDLFFTICGLVSTHTWILFSCNSDLTSSNVCLLVN